MDLFGINFKLMEKIQLYIYFKDFYQKKVHNSLLYRIDVSIFFSFNLIFSQFCIHPLSLLALYQILIHINQDLIPIINEI